MEKTTTRPEEQYFRSLSDEEQKKWIKKIINRMCLAYKINGKYKKDQLSEKLNLKSSGTIKSWVYNKRIPFHAMTTCSRNTHHSIDWLLNGKNPIATMNVSVREQINEKIIEHLNNSKRYNLTENDRGIAAVAAQILNDVESIMSVKFEKEFNTSMNH